MSVWQLGGSQGYRERWRMGSDTGQDRSILYPLSHRRGDGGSSTVVGHGRSFSMSQIEIGPGFASPSLSLSFSLSITHLTCIALQDSSDQQTAIFYTTISNSSRRTETQEWRRNWAQFLFNATSTLNADDNHSLTGISGMSSFDSKIALPQRLFD